MIMKGVVQRTRCSQMATFHEKVRHIMSGKLDGYGKYSVKQVGKLQVVETKQALVVGLWQ